jgi:NAD-dependent deacetylase
VAEECDVLLAVGSTLAVTPAAYVVDRARASDAKVAIINGGPTERDRYAHVLLRGGISPILTNLLLRAGLTGQ